MRIDGPGGLDLSIHEDQARAELDLRPPPPARPEKATPLGRLVADGLIWQLRLGRLALDVYAHGALKAQPSSPEPHRSRDSRPSR